MQNLTVRYYAQVGLVVRTFTNNETNNEKFSFEYLDEDTIEKNFDIFICGMVLTIII